MGAKSATLYAWGTDEYAGLKPVADLRQQLKSQLYVLLQNPLG